MKSAIILAGGLGTRLSKVVPDLPKPMAPVKGRPFLEYLLDYWIEEGINHFVLSVGYRHETITDFFGHRYKDAKLEYVIEKTPLGTGGGVLLAAEKLNKTASFLLLNGDTFFAVRLKILIEFASTSTADWCFSMFRSNELERYMGMDVSPQGQILSLKSNSTQLGNLSNGGVYWVKSSALRAGKFVPGDKVSLEEEILPLALSGGLRLMGIEFTETFIDIGVPSDYHRASIMLSR